MLHSDIMISHLVSIALGQVFRCRMVVPRDTSVGEDVLSCYLDASILEKHLLCASYGGGVNENAHGYV